MPPLALRKSAPAQFLDWLRLAGQGVIAEAAAPHDDPCARRAGAVSPALSERAGADDPVAALMALRNC